MYSKTPHTSRHCCSVLQDVPQHNLVTTVAAYRRMFHNTIATTVAAYRKMFHNTIKSPLLQRTARCSTIQLRHRHCSLLQDFHKQLVMATYCIIFHKQLAIVAMYSNRCNIQQVVSQTTRHRSKNTESCSIIQLSLHHCNVQQDVAQTTRGDCKVP